VGTALGVAGVGDHGKGNAVVTTTQRTRNTPHAALLTPQGRGAVASIRCVDSIGHLEAAHPALFTATNGKRLSDQSINRIVFGHWGQEPVEEVVLCRIDERTIDLHCHGGIAAADRIIDDLQLLDIEIVNWQDAITRIATKVDSEYVEAISQATTLRTAEFLLRQQTGLLRNAATDWLTRSEDWSAATRASLSADLEETLSWSEFGLHLTSPWRVVLAGRANVGKSSLINAMLGYGRAIVHDQPGTTRDIVTGETALDGWPVRFADTAGIRDAEDALEASGIERAQSELEQADYRLIVLDSALPATAGDHRLLNRWPDAIVIANKSDLPDRWDDEMPTAAIRVSALTGAGTDELAKVIVERLVPNLPETDSPCPVTPRQVELLTRAHAADSPEVFRSVLQELID
jgi:tRNA modification GTPase